MRILTILVLIVIAFLGHGQDVPLLQKQADSLYKAGEFKSAALTYSALSRLSKNQPGIFYRANLFAARSWTRINTFDSAFAAIDRIEKNHVFYHQLMSLVTEPELDPLRKDHRWDSAITKIFLQTTRECYPSINKTYVQEEVIYGRKDGMALTMLRISPLQIKPNGRSIIQIRSGGWGSNFYMPAVAEALPFIEKGYTVFIVFHGSEPVYSIPEVIDDVQRSVRFIRYNAKGYGLDPEKIAAIGNSAGGHLSLMVALSDSSSTKYSPDPVDRMSSKVQTAVSYYPVSNFLKWDSSGRTADSAFLFKEAVPHTLDFRHWDRSRRRFEYVTNIGEHQKILKQISPIHHVSRNDASILLFHGDQDRLVPIQQSELLVQKLKEANVSVSFQVKKGGGHGWPTSSEESTLIINWLDEKLR